MTLVEKIRTSFTTQLTLMVAAFVLVISGVVVFLLFRFSQEVIRDEAFETLKANVLHSLTDRMAAPIGQLCRSTETVCCDYDSLTESQMTALQGDITQATESITNLLDQLMAEPKARQS